MDGRIAMVAGNLKEIGMLSVGNVAVRDVKDLIQRNIELMAFPPSAGERQPTPR